MSLKVCHGHPTLKEVVSEIDLLDGPQLGDLRWNGSGKQVVGEVQLLQPRELAQLLTTRTNESPMSQPGGFKKADVKAQSGSALLCCTEVPALCQV